MLRGLAGQTPGVYHSWEDCLKQSQSIPR
ncbi:MAG: viroplasmin family protein [Saprospiraceae bacterium]|nr:viroplasmin family protein [Candidatus Vicinibacter affinis]